MIRDLLLETADGDFLSGVEVPCCACDGQARFLVRLSDGEPMLGHSQPVCERYKITDDADKAADYARDCRERVQ